MSSPTDYSKLKVTELRDALQKRNLPITGVKAELIARLTSADATTDAPSPAANKAHLPTADDYEVDWDDNDDPTPTPAPATTSTATPAAAPVVAAPAEPPATKPAESTVPVKTTEEKPKKKFASIAALFETPAATATTTPATKTPAKPAKDPQNSQSPSSPSTVTDEANGTAKTSAPAKPVPEPSFAAGLEASSLDVELERRKARAKRFCMDEDITTIEATKKLEREKRFGNPVTEDTSEKKEVVKGLDSALSEHRRERKRGAPGQGEGGRGGKRVRGGNHNDNHNGSGAGRGGDRDRRPQVPRRAAGGVQKSSSQKSGGYKAILDDPAEKAKAEARARKYGLAQ